MLTDLQIFGKRLKQARILKKFSMEALCSKMDGIVSKQAISKYESAKMLPNSTVLLALSTALDVEPEYFFRPFSFDVDKFSVSFRKKSDTSVKDINALKIQIQDQVERYLEIEELLGKTTETFCPIPGDIIDSAEQMRNLASQVRKDWLLGYDAIANVQDVLESKGIKVISTDAPDGFDGVSGVVNGKNYIIVLNNRQVHVERRRFTAMHELAHLLFNNRFSVELTQRDKENLCNSFASEMLLPSCTLKKYYKRGEKISALELRQLQLSYGISFDAIMHKLREIDIISESKYKSYCIQKNRDENLKRFAEESCYKENITNKFETMVYAAVARDLISTSKAASLLHVSVTTVRKHLNVI